MGAPKLNPQFVEAYRVIEQVKQRLRESIVGQETVVDLSLCALIGRGHLLLEGPPGVGKTSLALALAETFRTEFKRVQMTSDMLPSEIIGGLRPAADSRSFEFRAGPVFTNVLLADELNRASPKTQAALLEAMAEGSVSVDGVTHGLPHPFFVVATQNPSESFGVYPLPESQLDRFMIYATMNFPSAEFELSVYKTRRSSNATPKVNSREGFSPQVLQQLLLAAEQVYVEESVIRYLHAIVEATRKHPLIRGGASVRAGLQFVEAARARALIHGREFVTPADVHDLACDVLAHRLRLRDDEATIDTKRAVVAEILESIPAPK